MLGVCYYPEHWPQEMWAQDAKEMRELGLSYVRIAEFAWSKMEPNEGEYNFAWLDQAIDVLAAQGLKVIMCTPTATPPKWLIDKYPDILPVDIHTGQTRGFGSRRHYDFSSENYVKEAMRITEVLVKRYGKHPAICGWQTDNELACHDTTHSGSANARRAFQGWCAKTYGNIENLNEAWGSIFWSMEYQNFEQIELPILAVTETHLSHQLAYRRFSSDQVIAFHDQMIAIIREHAPNRFVTHNFIPMVDTQTDNFALADKLDFAAYDNYPLGRTDLFFSDMPAEQFKPYMRTGHPDFSSYSFDQVRGISHNNFWIMEQQPGPVNWGHHNPRPEKGMVRLWSWQAFAHGAEVVCYFRWRQAPFAQEQMHAGVKRSDNSKSQAWVEIERMRDELAHCGIDTAAKLSASVAIVTGTDNQWVTEIERQGDSYQHQQVEFAYYSALRRLGLNVDFISIEADLSQYQLIVAPCLPIVSQAFVDKCKASNAHIVFGPRSGSKTHELHIASARAPGLLQALIPIKVDSVETIRPDCSEALYFSSEHELNEDGSHSMADTHDYGQQTLYSSKLWREELSLAQGVKVDARYHDGSPCVARFNNVSYIASLSCDDFLQTYFVKLCGALAIPVHILPKDVRMVNAGGITYLFNYGQKEVTLEALSQQAFVLGSHVLAPFDVAIMRNV